MSTGAPQRPCFAVDIVRAGLDPLTGRTLSFSQLPRAVWAGHLCDLVLAGVLSPDPHTARLDDGPTPPLHPLLDHAVSQLAKHLPTTWAGCFRPAVVDPNRSTRQVQDWLVETGEWSRRRTILGPRYCQTLTPAERLSPPLGGSGPPPSQLRAAVLATLLGIARLDLTTHRDSVGHVGPDEINSVADGPPAVRDTLIAITTTIEGLIDSARVTIVAPNGF